MKELGKRLYLDSGTLTPLIKRLETMELVIRSRSKADERFLEVELTQKGKELEKEADHIPHEMFCQLKLTTDEFTDLRDKIKSWIHRVQ